MLLPRPPTSPSEARGRGEEDFFARSKARARGRSVVADSHGSRRVSLSLSLSLEDTGVKRVLEVRCQGVQVSKIAVFTIRHGGVDV